jgi:uncharacterized protein
MAIGKQIDTDIITAMKAKDEHKLTTLRMVKSALKSKAIDKRAELTDAEESQILSTLIKQRKESVDSFLKGNRPELAQKEREEIAMIEVYLPQEANREQVEAVVKRVIDQLTKDAQGAKPGPKDMGTAIKVAQQWILADGLRADGRMVSEVVKAELAK